MDLSLEATERRVSTPAPLVSSDGKDVREKVNVPLNRSFCDRLEALITPYRKVRSDYGLQWLRYEFGKLAEKGIYPLTLEGKALLLGTDLVPVANERVSERLVGDRSTLHRPQLGLSCVAPLLRGCFSLAGSRLANSLPADGDVDLTPRPARDLAQVHARDCAREKRGSR